MKCPQLSLRELFLLVVIAAMGCGWWAERRGRLEQERERGAIDENLRWLDAMDGSGVDLLAIDQIKKAYVRLPGRGFYNPPPD